MRGGFLLLKTFIQALIKIKDSILVILKKILSLLKLFIFGKSNKEPNKIALASDERFDGSITAKNMEQAGFNINYVVKELKNVYLSS